MDTSRLAPESAGNDWGEDAPTAAVPQRASARQGAAVAAPASAVAAPAVVEPRIVAPELLSPASNPVGAPLSPVPGMAPAAPAPAVVPAAPQGEWTDVVGDWADDDDDADEFEEEVARPGPRSRAVSESRNLARRGSKGGKGGKKQQGMRLTERDIEILSFLGRYRAATVNQIARHVDSSLYAIRNRLPRMHREGMLSWSFTGQAKPKVWTVTDTGLKVAGLNLSAPSISWGTLRHTLGLVDLGTTFELAGERVVTEREIRAALRYTPTARMRTAIDLYRALDDLGMSTDVDSHEVAALHYTLPIQGKNYGHIPDMVVVREPFENGAAGSIAVELELNRKTLSEWRNIITAYRDTSYFAQAVYYVVDVEIERALRGVIHALGAEHRVSVIRFEPLDDTATP